MANNNDNLTHAKKEKNNEFYTRMEDIAKELCSYQIYFKDKTVFCNCDDPTWSNFWKYFHQNFSEFGLKKLISTHYNADGSPSYKMEYAGGNDFDCSVGVKIPLQGNGDFRSEECIRILDKCDIVVTNPPFSEISNKDGKIGYIELLVQHKKRFIIISNKNAITYKDIFPLFKDNKMWIGYTTPEEFISPDGTITKQVKGLCRWFTNIDIPKRHKSLIEALKYRYKNHLDWYLPYDNYDAINVNKVKEIPFDYNGVMGVPITFMDNYNPDEFEILGQMANTHIDKNNHGYPFVNGKKMYARILIRRKEKYTDENK